MTGPGGEAPEPDDPPPGYAPMRAGGAFTGLIGPFYRRQDPDGLVWRGLRIGARHCNGAGIVHGGLFMSFADSLLGHALGAATGGLPLTMRLNAEFLATARPGDWLEGFARLTARDGDDAFGAAELSVGGRAVFRATAVFKIMARHRT